MGADVARLPRSKPQYGNRIMILRPLSFAALSAVLFAPLALAADDTLVAPGL